MTISAALTVARDLADGLTEQRVEPLLVDGRFSDSGHGSSLAWMVSRG